MVQIIGIALWALIPGFIAKKKGRSFWGYYLLSFLISPLITMIIALCVSKKEESDYLEYDPSRITECMSCGYRNKDYFDTCSECGKTSKRYVYLNNETEKEEVETNPKDTITTENKCEMCGHICDKTTAAKIEDEMGVRYRNLCDACMEIYHATPNEPTDLAELAESNINEPVSADKQIQFCRKCGEKLVENSRFCRKCGTEIVKGE